MRPYRNTMLIILLVFAGNVLMHPFSVNVAYGQASKSGETAFSAMSYCFGDVEATFNCVLSNTVSNAVVSGKNHTYSGSALSYLLYSSSFRDTILSKAFFRDFSIKNNFLFRNSGWYHVFALKKIII